MKKLNKFFAVLVALAMMATLCVSMAFAEDGIQAENVDLTKTLTKNAQTTTPDASFVFKVVKNTTKGDSHAVDIANQTFIYNSTADLTQKKDMDTVFEQALASAPNGMYVYDVMEDAAASTQTNTTADGKTTNTFTYSDKVYRVRIYKSGTADAPVYKYTVSEVTGYGTDNEVESKKPVTPGPEAGDEGTIDMPFENKYVKTTNVTPDGKDPEDDNDAAGLFVQKNVDNDASNLYADKEFEFTLNATAPAVNTLSTTKTGYAYKVMKVNGAEDTTKAGTLVPGTPSTVNLKTGERIVFTDLDVGATVTVKEADYSADFTATDKLNGTDVNTIASTNGTTATITENGNKLFVKNTAKNSTTPEGILISNLPYIALALVAIGGLVAYVVIRRRNADEA